MVNKHKFRIGLVVNPWAGIGGAVALKGSDGEDTAQRALALGAKQKAPERVKQALAMLVEVRDRIEFVTGADELGAKMLSEMGFAYESVYSPAQQPTTAQDTQNLAEVIANEHQVDVLLFAGGDGTARDICSVYPDTQAVLGIPAGVKIHSGVYAISPRAAGKVILQLVQGELASVIHADVMDIDEEAFRAGQVRARRYGELLVPAELSYVQAVKMGGVESDELVLHDIAEEIIENMEDDTLYIMGSGSTVAAVMDELGLANTLLGVDVVYNQELLLKDATAPQLEALLAESDAAVKLIITVIGGQGHIFGRGNQQLSPAVLEAIGRDNMQVIATKAKLQALNGRPLLVDTGKPELDDVLAGLMRVTTGYRDEVFVNVESA